jgi:hypothetical protein
LRVHFFKVAFVDEDLASFPTSRGRDEPFHFHHVDESSGATETDAKATLQI